jgi:hypothetical protein
LHGIRSPVDLPPAAPERRHADSGSSPSAAAIVNLKQGALYRLGRGVDWTFALDPRSPIPSPGLDLPLATIPALHRNIPGYGRIAGFRSA